MKPDKSLTKLLSLAGPPLRKVAPEKPSFIEAQGELGDELYAMLCERNGYYAFESALHVFPLGFGKGMDLETWNSAGLWRDRFGSGARGLLFFSEDVFGTQFALQGGRVHLFNPETGKAEDFSSDIGEWSARVLDDYEVLTGCPLAHAWQEVNGAIPRDRRLVPKIPFVLGGKFDLDNLYLADPVEAMRFRADLAGQIRDLPDGARIRLRVVDG